MNQIRGPLKHRLDHFFHRNDWKECKEYGCGPNHYFFRMSWKPEVKTMTVLDEFQEDIEAQYIKDTFVAMRKDNTRIGLLHIYERGASEGVSVIDYYDSISGDIIHLKYTRAGKEKFERIKNWIVGY